MERDTYTVRIVVASHWDPIVERRNFETAAMNSIISSIYESYDDFQFATNNETITE